MQGSDAGAGAGAGYRVGAGTGASTTLFATLKLYKGNKLFNLYVIGYFMKLTTHISSKYLFG